ncbi:MAG: AF1514 family protein [Candidatus Thiodiazotropha sp. (ex Ustalcina ferruginea)]|nr:AF1514 family protein [Candidatus Thiodiazotropha sp. (ex Ustalcina ferruginea)]
MRQDDKGEVPVCPIPQPTDLSAVEQLQLEPQTPVSDYLEAMELAKQEAERYLGENMLLSWYDRDRDFESPQHASECHQASATPGYVDYGVHHGARLMVDIEHGRFVFFFLPLDP